MTALGASLVLALGGVNVAYAGGFQLFEQSAAGLGVGHADATAGCGDASTEYSNPAGMVCMKKKQITLGIEAVLLHVKFKGTAGTDTNVPYTTRTGAANGGTDNYIPNFHYVIPVNERWYYGGGISVPFGLTTSYSGRSAAGLYATKSILKTINLSQDAAYKIDNQWSVGLGLDIQYFTGELDSLEPLGAPDPTVVDQNKASDTSLGWHGGVLYRMDNSTRFGLSYHSQITHNAKGKGLFKASSLGQGNKDQKTDVSTHIILPPSIAFGAYHKFDNNWAVMGNINYTMWSTIKKITLKNIFLLSESNDLTLPLHFKNSTAVSLGGTYQFTPKWQGKFGIGYDQSPVVKKYRELRLPDSDKQTISIGAHYQAKANLGLDVGYEHAFVNNAKVNTSIPVADTGANYVITGKYKNTSADLLGIQVTYKF